MPNETTIPADAIAGLLTGWVGPGLLAMREMEPIVVIEADTTNALITDAQRRVAYWPRRMIHLDCLRPEVQARVGSVLRAPLCVVHGRSDVHDIDGLGPNCDEYFSGRNPEGVGHRECWLRKRRSIDHILDAARTGALSNQHIAEAVAWSVRSVARGGEVLRGIMGPWQPCGESGESGDLRWGIVEYARAYLANPLDPEPDPAGWYFRRDGAVYYEGPETVPEGRAKADAACLSANIAYIDGGALVLPEFPTERT